MGIVDFDYMQYISNLGFWEINDVKKYKRRYACIHDVLEIYKCGVVG